MMCQAKCLCLMFGLMGFHCGLENFFSLFSVLQSVHRAEVAQQRGSILPTRLSLPVRSPSH